MKNEHHGAEWHLKHPQTRKWMVQCAGCKRWGYRHDAPARFFGRAHLEEHFEAMEQDERGICAHCRSITDLIGSVKGLPADLSARKKHYLRASRKKKAE